MELNDEGDYKKRLKVFWRNGECVFKNKVKKREKEGYKLEVKKEMRKEKKENKM
jgi:hypothetical protein